MEGIFLSQSFQTASEVNQSCVQLLPGLKGLESEDYNLCPYTDEVRIGGTVPLLYNIP